MKEALRIERAYRGGQLLAAHRFGEREREILEGLASEGQRATDLDALGLYRDMREKGFLQASENMLARYRASMPATCICPRGPHIIGTNIYGSTYCQTCFESWEQENATRKHASTSRIPVRKRRVQQSQHRYGARREENEYRSKRRRNIDYEPFRRVPLPGGGWREVLRRKWAAVKGLVLCTSSMDWDARQAAREHNRPIITAELCRRKEW